MLLLRPVLPRLGDGVRLPHLLAGVLPRPGRVGRRRRRAGGDHRAGDRAREAGDLSTCGDGRVVFSLAGRSGRGRWRRPWLAVSLRAAAARLAVRVVWRWRGGVVALGGWGGGGPPGL